MMLKNVKTGVLETDPVNVQTSVEGCLNGLSFNTVKLYKSLHTTLKNETRTDNSIYVFGCGNILPHLPLPSCGNDDKGHFIGDISTEVKFPGRYRDKMTLVCLPCQKG